MKSLVPSQVFQSCGSLTPLKKHYLVGREEGFEHHELTTKTWEGGSHWNQHFLV